MVNNPNPRLASPTLKPEPLTSQNRMLGRKRIYDLRVVKSLVSQHGLVLLNDDADFDATQLLNMSPGDVAEFIGQLSEKNYVNSQWCRTSVGKAVDCDSYVMKYNRNKKVPWEHGPRIYVKFGFLPNLPKCVVCSVHFG